MHQYVPEKDYTDTDIAVKLALKLIESDSTYDSKCSSEKDKNSIHILGGTGTRLDHVLANVYLLGIGLEENVSIQLVDKHNRIRMIDSSLAIRRNEQFGDYISILPVKGDAKGVNLEGMKYPLCDAEVSCFSSLGVSNEIIDEVAKILVTQGTLLVIESRD